MNGDCNDADATVNPNAIETCDLVDNDCDGLIDDNDPSLDQSDTTTWFADVDQDGFGNAAVTINTCVQPTSFVANDLDCNDSNAATNPSAFEICDNEDNNCNGSIDDNASDALTWFIDNDNDGSVETVPSHHVNFPLDTHSKQEIVTTTTQIRDQMPLSFVTMKMMIVMETSTMIPSTQRCGLEMRIADSFGNPGTTVSACTPPNGFVDNADDCDDGNNSINPDAIEVCDSLDNDCDALIDDQDSNLGGFIPKWSPDIDQDSYGDLHNRNLSMHRPNQLCLE